MSPWYSHDIVDYIPSYPIIDGYNHHYSHEISSIPMINFLTPMMLSWWYPNSHDIPMIFELNPPSPSPTWSSQGFFQSRCQRLGLHRLWRHRHLCPYQGWFGDPWAINGPMEGPGELTLWKKKEWSWMMFTLEDTLRFIQELSCYKYTEQLMLNMGCFFDYPIVGVHLQECGCCWEGWTECFMFDIWWLIWLVIFRVQSCLAWHPNTISTPAKLFVLFDFQNTSNHSSCFQWIGRLCHHLWDGETKNGKSYGIWWSSIWKHKKHLETRIAWEISSQPAETFWASTWNSALEPEHQRS